MWKFGQYAKERECFHPSKVTVKGIQMSSKGQTGMIQWRLRRIRICLFATS